MIEGIMEGIASGHTSDGYIISSLNIIKSQRFVLFTLIILSLTAAFTYLVARITLLPAKNALDSQKRFISDIAHELRTPLAVIKTNSEVFLMDSALSPKIREIVESNIEELDRTSEIINNLLTFNNLIHPDRIKFADVDMGLLVDTVASKLQNLAEKKNLEITIKKVSPHVVWGNAVALEQIVTNLLKNSINYSGQGGHITIGVGPDYIGNIVLHVEDTGMGISKHDLLHIFEPFYRAERSRNRKKGSSGLGLTIVSELVKMHSGRITIKSLENKGTIAIVAFPYKEKHREQKVDFADLNEISVNFLQKRKEQESTG